MAVVQNTYQERVDKGIAGMPASTSPCVKDTYIADGSNGIPYGRAVKRSVAGDGHASLGVGGNSSTAGDANDWIGVSFRDLAVVGTDTDANIDRYKDNDLMVVVSMGDIWVEVEAAVTSGQKATCSRLTGEISAIAVNAATDNTGQYSLPGAYFLTSASAGGLAKLRLGTFNR